MQQKAWNKLGIPPTENTALIRQAYANGLKKNHPEDHPKGFLQLRQAYEQAMAWARNIPEPFSLLPLENDLKFELSGSSGTLAEPMTVFKTFWEQHSQGQHTPAIQELAAWWFHPDLPTSKKYDFNRLFMDAVLEKGMKPPQLANIIWAIYWPGSTFFFGVTATSQQQADFKSRIKQALSTSLWHVRYQFSQTLFGEGSQKAFEELETLWLSPEFDHYGKRMMLRTLFLRYAAPNAHLTKEHLAELDRIFQFRHASDAYQEDDLASLMAFEKRLRA